MEYRVYKELRGFIDIEAENEDEAYTIANEKSLNEYDFFDEDTDVQVKPTS